MSGGRVSVAVCLDRVSVALWCSVLLCCIVLQCVAVCCSVSQCVAVCCSVLQCVAVCCSVLQCVAVCCSVSQCVEIEAVLQCVMNGERVGVAVCEKANMRCSSLFCPER